MNSYMIRDKVIDNSVYQVYTYGMSKYAVINLKTDPLLKKKAAETAEQLGVSISAVLNNELRRFAAQKSVVFDIPEIPNTKTSKEIEESRVKIEAGEFYDFDNNDEALEFLAKELK